MIRSFLLDGTPAWELSSGQLSVRIISYGATVISVRFRGRELALGYKTLAEYKKYQAYVGAIIGRYGNRIAGARCRFGADDLKLTANEGKNQLHGGINAFDKQLWQGEILSEDSLKLSLVSPAGDNGFPGTLSASVTYSVTKNGLRLDFGAQSDADTIYAPTTHIYWNLGAENVYACKARIAADRYLPVDEELIPTGEIASVKGTMFDLRHMRRLKPGYDHCFVLNEKRKKPCVEAKSAYARMRVETDFPAFQLFTCGDMNPETDGYEDGAGFAVEAESLPDTPNHPEFGSALLPAGESYHKFIQYKFF